MKKLVSFRPNVIGNRTAYECQAMIYRYLQSRHGYLFTIIKAEGVYEDPAFNIVSIPQWVWKPIPHTHFFPPSYKRRSMLLNLFVRADGILTVDPTIEQQALLAIRAAKELGKPLWLDSSETLMGKGDSIRWKIARRIIKPLLMDVSGIIITVPKCIERFRDIGLFDADIAKKFVVMGHPVDTTHYKPTRKHSEEDGIIRVLVVSRLVPRRGATTSSRPFLHSG